MSCEERTRFEGALLSGSSKPRSIGSRKGRGLDSGAMVGQRMGASWTPVPLTSLSPRLPRSDSVASAAPEVGPAAAAAAPRVVAVPSMNAPSCSHWPPPPHRCRRCHRRCRCRRRSCRRRRSRRRSRRRPRRCGRRQRQCSADPRWHDDADAWCCTATGTYGRCATACSGDHVHRDTGSGSATGTCGRCFFPFCSDTVCGTAPATTVAYKAATCAAPTSSTLSATAATLCHRPGMRAPESCTTVRCRTLHL